MPIQTDGLLSNWVRERRFRKVVPFLRGRVLDYGCGVGEFAKFGDPANYLGVERDDVSLETARSNFPQFQFEYSVEQEESFDTIVALALLEHLKDPVSLLCQFGKMLNPGGRILLTVPHPAYYGIHAMCARMGLLSMHACEDHHQEITYAVCLDVAKSASLDIVGYERFLFGANQFFILAPRNA